MQKIAAWQVKGEFEKTIENLKRVNNKSRSLIIEEFYWEAFQVQFHLRATGLFGLLHSTRGQSTKKASSNRKTQEL